jgi:hypothetical protein
MKSVKIKKSCLCKERFQYLCILLRFVNTLGLTPSNDVPGENSLVLEPPVQQKA